MLNTMWRMPRVQEAGGDDPVPLAVGDGRAVERASRIHRASRREARSELRAARDLRDEGDDVDRDQRVGGGCAPEAQARA